jgi:hypothetical protein
VIRTQDPSVQASENSHALGRAATVIGFSNLLETKSTEQTYDHCATGGYKSGNFALGSAYVNSIVISEGKCNWMKLHKREI